MGWRNNPAQSAIGKAIRHQIYTLQAVAEFLSYADGTHPELCDAVLKCGATSQAVLDVLLQIHDDAWGALPADLARLLGNE